jgi:hypothetical protein
MADTTDRPAFEVPPPDPELRRLEPLIGSWESEDHTENSVLGSGVLVTNRETFRWLDGGYFLAQDYETTFGDEPRQRGINFWGYDSDAGMFRIIFFSNNGPYTEEGNRYAGRVKDDRLTMVGPARFAYQLDTDGRIKVNPEGTISVAWWLRDEGGEWRPWMNNTFRRRVEPQTIRQ